MIRLVTLAHKWVGGVCGLLLAILGLSGALLVYKDNWTLVAHKNDPFVMRSLTQQQVVAQAMQSKGPPAQMVAFASPELTVHRIAYANGRGAYLDQQGRTVAAWSSEWARPELWLVSLHRYLFARPAGETWVGSAGVVGLLLVVSGIISWWRTRKTFEARLWPKRFSRAALVRYHKDSGILITPVLVVSLVTGVVMAFKPVANVLLGPGSAAAISQALKPPAYLAVPVAKNLDWQKIVQEAGDRFPQAQFRSIALPRKGSGLITVRLRQPAEWLPSGRTMVWFAADTGQLVGARDATQARAQAQAFNMIFPVHTGKMAGALHQLIMALSGLVLCVLGLFSCWTFWFAGGVRDKVKRTVPQGVGSKSV